MHLQERFEDLTNPEDSNWQQNHTRMPGQRLQGANKNTPKSITRNKREK
jgi:hypothetical protein